MDPNPNGLSPIQDFGGWHLGFAVEGVLRYKTSLIKLAIP